MKLLILILIIILAGIGYVIYKETKTYRTNPINTVLRIIFAALWIIVLPVGIFEWFTGITPQASAWKYYHLAYISTLAFIPVSVICMLISKWMELQHNSKLARRILMIPILNLMMSFILLYQLFHLPK